jgi:hypothetical protein
MQEVMMKLLLALLVIVPNLAIAQESRFLVNQEEQTNQIQLTFGGVEYTNEMRSEYFGYSRTTRSGTSAQFNYSHNFAELQKFNLGAELFLRQKQASGLRALNAGYRGGIAYDQVTWIFGADLALSPGQSNLENAFRGYHTARLQSGVESYAGPVAIAAVGVFESHISSTNQSKDKVFDDAQTIGFEATAELPVYKNISAGLGLGVSRSTGNMGDPLQIISGASDNGYNSQIFSSYKMDKDALINLQIKNEKLAEPMDEKSSSISIGYTQTL